MIDYLEDIAKIHGDKDSDFSAAEILHKSFTSLSLLIYNLDETSQKS
jgi:hypothetical protein